MVGENLESFSLGESEKAPPGSGSGTANTKNEKVNAWAINTALVQISAPPLRRSLFSNVPPTINFVHHNEVSVSSLPAGELIWHQIFQNLMPKNSTMIFYIIQGPR